MRPDERALVTMMVITALAIGGAILAQVSFYFWPLP